MHESSPVDEAVRIELDGRVITLVGTAHISRESVREVREVIRRVEPDTVCVEIDEGRLKALEEREAFADLDMREIIRRGQLLFFFARLALASFQKKMGSYTGVRPGEEMIAAIESARARGAEVALIDRDVRATLLRAWRTTPWWKRAALGVTLGLGVFEKTEVSEEELTKLKREANLGAIMDELGDELPSLKRVVVDERDAYMAERIRRAPGSNLVVVIGAAHRAGIRAHLERPIEAPDLDELSAVPPRGALSKLIPWLVPLLVAALFAWGIWRGDWEAAREAASAWVLANGVFAAAAAAAALAHPLTIAASFVAAPITSLIPVLGAGMVAALVQALLVPPKVSDFERAGDDISESWRGWWSNRLTRLLLVFLFVQLGSVVGTFVALPYLTKLIG